MSVARITEIKSTSKKSFDDAIDKGIKRACKTLKNVKGVWIAEQDISISDGKIERYRVLMKVTFVLDE